METQKKVELLAPAGCPQAFYGAVGAGADAVYLGGKKFGARAYAENFTEESLAECIRYGRLFGVKVYLTANTLFRERELDELLDFLGPLCEAGLSGVIVQDLGALIRIRERFPSLKLHASTQMSLCADWGAALLKERGVSRIIPARELSLSELKELKRRSGLEIETFIHGAMCYCYSGQCLFSSILGGRSGNRGRCAQPCRLPYRVKGGAEGNLRYPLSLKDLCTVRHIPALIDAGIDSFKIEGRMKKPEYAAGVTAVYRKYIDGYYSLRETLGPEEAAKAFQVSREDEKILESLYVRSSLQDGYYFRKNGRGMVTPDSPAYSGADGELSDHIRKAYLEKRPRLQVEMDAEFLTGMPAKITLRRKETVVQALGEPVGRAQNRPLTEEALRDQLDRLGETPFAASEIQIRVSDNAFYPLKEINRLRRQALQDLEDALCKDGGEEGLMGSVRRPGSFQRPGSPFLTRVSPGWAVSVRTLEQLSALTETLEKPDGENPFRLRRLYADGDLLLENTAECLSLFEKLAESAAGGCREERPLLLASLPYVTRRRDAERLNRLWELALRGMTDGFLVRSLDGLGFLLARERESGKRVCLRADAGLSVWNSAAAALLSELTDGLCLPYELNAAQQDGLLEKTSGPARDVLWEKVVYGRIPLMVTANCIQKNTDRCIGDGEGILVLEDRLRAEFPVLRNCGHCYNVIYNSLPLSLIGGTDRFRERADRRLDFTLETGRELGEILRACLRDVRPALPYTTGHEKRGVE